MFNRPPTHEIPDSPVATRYDRCPIVFLSAVALAATVLFWL